MKIKQAKTFFYRINQAETENMICCTFNTCKQGIIRNNDKLKFYAGEWIEICSNDFEIHHVKPIETLTSIANKYNTSVEKLIVDNNLKTDKLFVGQCIKIK